MSLEYFNIEKSLKYLILLAELIPIEHTVLLVEGGGAPLHTDHTADHTVHADHADHTDHTVYAVSIRHAHCNRRAHCIRRSTPFRIHLSRNYERKCLLKKILLI